MLNTWLQVVWRSTRWCSETVLSIRVETASRQIAESFPLKITCRSFSEEEASRSIIHQSIITIKEESLKVKVQNLNIGVVIKKIEQFIYLCIQNFLQDRIWNLFMMSKHHFQILILRYLFVSVYFLLKN
jgi:hypothetical protein